MASFSAHARGFQIAVAQRSKFLPVAGFHTSRMPQPVIASAGQPVVSLRPKLFVLPPPELIDGFGEVFGDMKFIEDDLAARLRQMVECRGHIRIPHIHCNSLDGLDLLGSQGRPELVQTFSGPVLRHEQYTAAVQVVHHREVMMSAGERLLVNAQPGNGFGFAPFQPALYRPRLDRMHFVPTQMQAAGNGLLTCRPKPVDGQRLE